MILAHILGKKNWQMVVRSQRPYHAFLNVKRSRPGIRVDRGQRRGGWWHGRSTWLVAEEGPLKISLLRRPGLGGCHSRFVQARKTDAAPPTATEGYLKLKTIYLVSDGPA
jgi:hypothetical protein